MSKKVKPAIFSGPLGWGWVELEELAEIIGQSPEQTWRNYFWLSKDAPEMEVLSWSPDLERFIQKAGEEPDFSHQVFVPAGWAFDVLAAKFAGFVRVEAINHEHQTEFDGECPENTLSCSFNGSCFTAVVGIKA